VPCCSPVPDRDVIVATQQQAMTEDFHLYLDSADLAELRACLPHPVVHGVTTNPTLLLRAGMASGAPRCRRC
jgi:transaldolase